MAEMFFPFPSNNGDRMVGVETYERMLGTIFTQGIFPRGEMLSVLAGGGMRVQVMTGSAIIVRTGNRASLYHNTVPVTLTVGIADGVAERIDTLVLRRDNTARKISLMLIPGTPSGQPVSAGAMRNEDLWDLVIAKIHVHAGVTEITQADIEDTRSNNELCGTVTSIAEIDSGNFYFQQQALFDDWFANLKTTLSGDVAGNLANQIYDLQQHTVNVECEIVNEPVTISASGWTENTAEMRMEYILRHASIKADNDVKVVLPNSWAGRTDLVVLPEHGNGAIVLYSNQATTTQKDITVQLIIKEVRPFA